MKRNLFFLLAPFLFSPAFAQEDEAKPVDVDKLNHTLSDAIAKGESWTNDPTLIASHLTGPWITNEADSEPASMQRRVLGTSKGGENTGPVTVVVKEIGLFDDAVRQIDHLYRFVLKDGNWTIKAATVKNLNARPAFPALVGDKQKRRVAKLLIWSSGGVDLNAQAKANGIDDLGGLVTKAIGEKDPEALAKVLKLGSKTDGAASEAYAELVYGLSALFERQTFQRFLFFNLEEKEREAVEEFIEWVETDLLPE
ncbi:MAG: hypothetical protein HKN23_19460 [Verrucomicrobiales bacterium]|nr:hypothetical protein [Verrucomicrobiales bacterium]